MDPHKPIYISSGTMRSICPRPTPSSTCLTLTPCHGRGGCRERSVTLPTKRCWRCWGRYILYELGRIGRLGRLGRFSLMVYFAHKATLALLGKVHISSLGGGSPLLFSLLTLLSTTPCFFLLLTPLLVSTCVSQVLGKERFPTINQILTRPSPSYVAVREMQKVREEEGEKGKGGGAIARECVS